MGRRGKGPCGCFGLTLEQGSQIFAIFDIVRSNKNIEYYNLNKYYSLLNIKITVVLFILLDR